MASTVDWRDAHNRAIELSGPLVQSANLDSKDRKYQNLQSSVFGGGYIVNAPILHDRTQKKSTFASHVDWTDSSTHTKVFQNDGSDGSTVTAFKLKQKCLSSSVLDQTDHSKFLPPSKAMSEAMLRKLERTKQLETQQRKPVPK